MGREDIHHNREPGDQFSLYQPHHGWDLGRVNFYSILTAGTVKYLLREAIFLFSLFSLCSILKRNAAMQLFRRRRPRVFLFSFWPLFSCLLSFLVSFIYIPSLLFPDECGVKRLSSEIPPFLFANLVFKHHARTRFNNLAILLPPLTLVFFVLRMML